MRLVHIPLLGPDLVVRGARHQDNDPYAARAANRDVLIEMQAILLIVGHGARVSGQADS